MSTLQALASRLFWLDYLTQMVSTIKTSLTQSYEHCFSFWATGYMQIEAFIHL